MVEVDTLISPVVGVRKTCAPNFDIFLSSDLTHAGQLFEEERRGTRNGYEASKGSKGISGL